MISGLKRAVMGIALAATTFTVAGNAEARDRYGRGDGDDTAAIAIGAGIVGLAVGALLADRDDDRYYDRSYYRSRRYVSVDGYPDYYYYYDGYPRRYYRDRYYDRHYGRYYRDYNDRRHYNRWERGKRRYDRYYGRHNYDHNGYRRGHRGDRYYDRGRYDDNGYRRGRW